MARVSLGQGGVLGERSEGQGRACLLECSLSVSIETESDCTGDGRAACSVVICKDTVDSGDGQYFFLGQYGSSIMHGMMRHDVVQCADLIYEYMSAVRWKSREYEKCLDDAAGLAGNGRA